MTNIHHFSVKERATFVDGDTPVTRLKNNIIDGKAQQFAIPEIDTVFHFYKPALPLSKFVDSLWLYQGGGIRHRIERVLPTGTFELAINLRDDHLGFHDPERPAIAYRLSGSVLSGAHGHGFAPDDSEEVFIIGVHFKPGGAFPFFSAPASDLANTHIDLESIWGASSRVLRERLCEAGSFGERFRLLESALLDRLHETIERHYAVSAGLEIFAGDQCGPKVREAAATVGLSERRFIQVFKSEVGLTPKLFSRIQRFQQARSSIHRRALPDWTSLALELGYFDQSHLVREFVEFSGRSPTAYLNQYGQGV